MSGSLVTPTSLGWIGEAADAPREPFVSILGCDGSALEEKLVFLRLVGHTSERKAGKKKKL